jgi:hypothetical protein
VWEEILRGEKGGGGACEGEFVGLARESPESTCPGVVPPPTYRGGTKCLRYGYPRQGTSLRAFI